MDYDDSCYLGDSIKYLLLESSLYNHLIPKSQSWTSLCPAYEWLRLYSNSEIVQSKCFDLKLGDLFHFNRLFLKEKNLFKESPNHS